LILEPVLQLAITVRVEQHNEPDWLPVAIAGGAAVLGAIAGGFASYFANERLETRRREARAAVRRSAKVYTPLRSQLIALSAVLDKDEHLMWGKVSRRGGDEDDRTPRFDFWDQLVEDGRATTSVTKPIRERLQTVVAAIDEFNRSVEAADRVFRSHGERIYLDVTGQPMTRVDWPGHRMRVEIVRARDQTWELFGFTEQEKQQNAEKDKQFRDRFNAVDDVANARGRIEASEESLKSAIRDAQIALEQAMERIARKYEKEAPKD
jgi:hypothetical protein